MKKSELKQFIKYTSAVHNSIKDRHIQDKKIVSETLQIFINKIVENKFNEIAPRFSFD